jgi:glycosyltransferase involved in cell wall biosynthesis
MRALTTRRALVVSRHPYPIQTTLRRNVAELLAQGVAVDLICLTPRLSWAAQHAGQPGLRIYGVPMRTRRTHALWYPVHYVGFFVWAFTLASMLALRHRYQVVQVDNTPDFLIFTALVPRLRRMRVVLFVMELMPELTAARLAVQAGAFPVRVTAWLERVAVSLADHVITVSEPCRRILVERGLAPAKVTVVPNSHSVAGLLPTVPTRPPFLVIQTTLIERYGVHLAIRALAELGSKWPDLTLQVLGEGEAQSSLVELAAGLGLSRRVVFSGRYLPWDEMIDRVRQATIGIVPILADGYGELVLPNKILEFAALGIPTVCSRLLGIEEHFPDNSLAYFEPGDARGLAAQVDRLLANPDDAQRQARTARMAMAALAWESVSPRYLEALRLGSVHAPRSATPRAAVSR